MSWIFAVYGNFTEDDREKFRKIHESPLFQFMDEKFYIAAGGYAGTLVSDFVPDTKEGFLICGVSVKNRDSDFSFMKQCDWQKILEKDELNFDTVDGHFAGIKWTSNTLTAFTDPLGGRDMYIATIQGYTVVSTRLDMITKLHSNAEINFGELGAYLYLRNHYSDRSIITNTKRLTYNGRAVITDNSVKIKNSQWLPDNSTNLHFENAEVRLKNLISFPQKEGYRLNFSLSGGMDSRVLLALFIANGIENFDAHTFGNKNHPDSTIALKMSKLYQFNFEQFDEPIPTLDESLELIRQFTKYTLVSSPASEFLNKRYYKNLSAGKNVIIDGGFGEIARRSLFNKVLFKGKQSLIDRDIDKTLKILTFDRFSFFSKDVISEIDRGNAEQIGNLFEDMPDIKKFGIENWLDLLAIRTKHTNYTALEQARCDGEGIVYTPFLFRYFLDYIFNVPKGDKLNARIFRKIILENAPKLATIPLVKGNIILNYHLSTFASKVIGKVKQKAGYSYNDPTIHLFLGSMKQYIYDTIQSDSVRNCPYYDVGHLNKIVSEYYAGKREYAKEIDWWLSFEIFRQEFK